MKRPADDRGPEPKRHPLAGSSSESSGDDLRGVMMVTQAGSGQVPAPRAIHPPLVAEFEKFKTTSEKRALDHSKAFKELFKECQEGIRDVETKTQMLISDIGHNSYSLMEQTSCEFIGNLTSSRNNFITDLVPVVEEEEEEAPYHETKISDNCQEGQAAATKRH
ncbi:hypothetical protein CAEBREN_29332 [Caenorhabditis brenneri]|uniref:Uncharacterized protein n=1 Tax=Caenorhabditis brenneri TaxID=135651 RepID=G0P3L9_CAEBE|nr:hypothetical protein CAEBREN_29332 [Caenorhabditis brenneri]